MVVPFFNAWAVPKAQTCPHCAKELPAQENAINGWLATSQRPYSNRQLACSYFGFMILVASFWMFYALVILAAFSPPGATVYSNGTLEDQAKALRAGPAIFISMLIPVLPATVSCLVLCCGTRKIALKIFITLQILVILIVPGFMVSQLKEDILPYKADFCERTVAELGRGSAVVLKHFEGLFRNITNSAHYIEECSNENFLVNSVNGSLIFHSKKEHQKLLDYCLWATENKPQFSDEIVL